MLFMLDVETSKEALQEDEELIEAVETLVETAAETLKTQVMEDVEDFSNWLIALQRFYFPFVDQYRQDEDLLWDDLRKCGIALCVFVLGYILTSPRRRRNDNPENPKEAVVPNTTALSPLSAQQNYKSLNALSTAAALFEDEITTRNLDELTEEQRYKQLWPRIKTSPYRRLVLPPTCQLTKSSSSWKRHSRKPKHQPKRVVVAKKRKIKKEDDPSKRLKYYLVQFWGLCKSFLTYDYTGTGWTLIHWLQTCLRIREMRRSNSAPMILVDEEDDDDDDESDDDEDDAASRNSFVSAKGNHAPSSPQSRIRPTKWEDEKKESPDHSFPGSPRTPLHYGNTLYGTPNPEATDGGETPQVLPPALVLSASNGHNHNFVLKPKRKNALESYRTSNPTVHSAGPSKNAPATAATDAVGTEQNFFETASSAKSLRRMSVETAGPDSNGYILGDDLLEDPKDTPLLVFVNSRAGPQQGQLLITQLRRLLNPIQVWDLAHGHPDDVLQSFTTAFSRLRILVCGGDGTVSWIISALETLGNPKWPPIAILPLGTGNDLARIHGWGGGYNNESLIGILEQISESYISMLDRWEMTVENRRGKVQEVKSFFNYLGVGADAQAALQVHMLRERQPQLFFSRMVNKLWYGVFGAEDIIKASSVNLPNEITLVADGVEVPLPADSQGIILLNIDSYSGGVALWANGSQSGLKPRPDLRRTRSLDELRSTRSPSMDRVDSVDDMSSILQMTDEEKFARVTACDKPSSCQDGVLDVVSIRGAFHLGQIRVGLSNAQKLCQCREATIHIKQKVPVQIDGEPWRQTVCTLTVKRKNESALMLHRSPDESGGVETEMSKLLEWAEERELIDGKVHSALMKEWSRRIEKKTRQRRVRTQDNLVFSLKRAIGSTRPSAIQTAPFPGGIAF